MDGAPVGFASLDGAETIDMLYVHPAAVAPRRRRDAVRRAGEARRRARRHRLTVDASDTALDFFERRGFVPQQRNTVPCGGEWLANTTMEKKLRGEHGAMNRPDTPFPRHWLYYIVLKIVVHRDRRRAGAQYFGVW